MRASAPRPARERRAVSPRSLAALAVAVWALTAPRSAGAQEFAVPEPAAGRSFASLLERGLPPDSSGFETIALAIRWHGVPELDTRSLAAGVGWRQARIAGGVSQTGDAELGWNSAVLAAGVASGEGGAALRACARRRRATTAESGVELGAAAWLAASSRVVLWAAAPQIWTRGDPPPLERWLEIGAAGRLGDLELWLARIATPGAPRGLSAEHLAGVRTRSGLLAIWIEARDRPLRGALGLAAATRGLGVAAAVESHPVLGETVRLALTLGGGSGR